MYVLVYIVLYKPTQTIVSWVDDQLRLHDRKPKWLNTDVASHRHHGLTSCARVHRQTTT